ncbi:unnamed protein product, partial [Polarella glacialis]
MTSLICRGHVFPCRVVLALCLLVVSCNTWQLRTNKDVGSVGRRKSVGHQNTQSFGDTDKTAAEGKEGRRKSVGHQNTQSFGDTDKAAAEGKEGRRKSVGHQNTQSFGDTDKTAAERKAGPRKSVELKNTQSFGDTDKTAAERKAGPRKSVELKNTQSFGDTDKTAAEGKEGRRKSVGHQNTQSFGDTDKTAAERKAGPRKSVELKNTQSFGDTDKTAAERKAGPRKSVELKNTQSFGDTDKTAAEGEASDTDKERRPSKDSGKPDSGGPPRQASKALPASSSSHPSGTGGKIDSGMIRVIFSEAKRIRQKRAAQLKDLQARSASPVQAKRGGKKKNLEVIGFRTRTLQAMQDILTAVTRTHHACGIFAFTSSMVSERKAAEERTRQRMDNLKRHIEDHQSPDEAWFQVLRSVGWSPTEGFDEGQLYESDIAVRKLQMAWFRYNQKLIRTKMRIARTHLASDFVLEALNRIMLSETMDFVEERALSNSCRTLKVAQKMPVMIAKVLGLHLKVLTLGGLAQEDALVTSVPDPDQEPMGESLDVEEEDEEEEEEKDDDDDDFLVEDLTQSSVLPELPSSIEEEQDVEEEVPSIDSMEVEDKIHQEEVPLEEVQDVQEFQQEEEAPVEEVEQQVQEEQQEQVPEEEVQKEQDGYEEEAQKKAERRRARRPTVNYRAGTRPLEVDTTDLPEIVPPMSPRQGPPRPLRLQNALLKVKERLQAYRALQEAAGRTVETKVNMSVLLTRFDGGSVGIEVGLVAPEKGGLEWDLVVLSTEGIQYAGASLRLRRGDIIRRVGLAINVANMLDELKSGSKAICEIEAESQRLAEAEASAANAILVHDGDEFLASAFTLAREDTDVDIADEDRMQLLDIEVMLKNDGGSVGAEWMNTLSFGGRMRLAVSSMGIFESLDLLRGLAPSSCSSWSSTPGPDGVADQVMAEADLLSRTLLDAAGGSSTTAGDTTAGEGKGSPADFLGVVADGRGGGPRIWDVLHSKAGGERFLVADLAPSVQDDSCYGAHGAEMAKNLPGARVTRSPEELLWREALFQVGAAAVAIRRQELAQLSGTWCVRDVNHSWNLQIEQLDQTLGWVSQNLDALK